MSANSKILSPGELAVGMFVTVHNHAPYTKEHVSDGGLFSGPTVVTTKTHDRSWYGDVLTIKAIDLPYIVFQAENNCPTDKHISTLDTRRTTLMELSDEYVLALHPYLKNKIEEKNKKNEQ